jgi:L-threonylcarbamoyladenylate synthase
VNWLLNHRVRLAANLMHAGEIIAYPTEAVWGLGCDPMDRDAVLELLALKNRPLEKGVILIAASLEQVRSFIRPLTDQEVDRITENSGTPTTWVIPASDRAPFWITGGRDSLAVRITSHPLAGALCLAFGGPIVSTSANPGGMAPAMTALRVRQYFGDRVHVVHGPLGGSIKPSEIKDLETGKIFRSGG